MTGGTRLLRTSAKPILFSGPMVRAILEGRKTQTRRVVVRRLLHGCREPPPEDTTRWYLDRAAGLWMADAPSPTGGTRQTVGWMPCPYGRTGDTLWVRETWCEVDRDGWDEIDRPRDYLSTRYGVPRRNGCAYLADSLRNGHEDADSKRCREELSYRWRPSIHMPRWASRLTLRVTDVRVQRVQEVSEDDARAEGFPDPDGMNREYADRARYWFHQLWDSINAKRGYSWESNPWVWAVSFEVES